MYCYSMSLCCPIWGIVQSVQVDLFLLEQINPFISHNNHRKKLTWVCLKIAYTLAISLGIIMITSGLIGVPYSNISMRVIQETGFRITWDNNTQWLVVSNKEQPVLHQRQIRATHPLSFRVIELMIKYDNYVQPPVEYICEPHPLHDHIVLPHRSHFYLYHQDLDMEPRWIPPKVDVSRAQTFDLRFLLVNPQSTPRLFAVNPPEDYIIYYGYAIIYHVIIQVILCVTYQLA